MPKLNEDLIYWLAYSLPSIFNNGVNANSINPFIYVRNLQLKNDWQKIPAGLRLFLLLLPVFAFGWMFLGTNHNFRSIFAQTDLTSPLIIIGAIGQLMLNLRFVYQWYYSEKHKTSLLPLGFWIMSTIASVLILTYASY